jgi:hypothetical protein
MKPSQGRSVEPATVRAGGAALVTAALWRALDELRPGAEIKHLGGALAFIALIGLIGLLLMMAVRH